MCICACMNTFVNVGAPQSHLVDSGAVAHRRLIIHGPIPCIEVEGVGVIKKNWYTGMGLPKGGERMCAYVYV